MLLGTAADATARVAARCFGIALLALAVACWPGQGFAADGPREARAMLVFNAAIALFLAYLGTLRQMAACCCGPLSRCMRWSRCCWSGRGGGGNGKGRPAPDGG